MTIKKTAETVLAKAKTVPIKEWICLTGGLTALWILNQIRKGR